MTEEDESEAFDQAMVINVGVELWRSSKQERRSKTLIDGAPAEAAIPKT